MLRKEEKMELYKILNQNQIRQKNRRKKGQGLDYSLKTWQKPITLIVILNVNGISSPVKRQRLSMD